MSQDELNRLTADLSDASFRRAWAARRAETAKSQKDRRFAEEDVQFYSNRAAYIAAWIKANAA